MAQIDWAKDNVAELSEVTIESAARELFAVYQTTVLGGKPDEELTSLELIAVAAGEDYSREFAENLARTYAGGSAPLMLTDFTLYISGFACRLIERFREPIYIELREAKDAMLLAPTIATLLSLPAEFAALAVPIAAVVVRIGTVSPHSDLERASQDGALLREMLQLHKANLRFVEIEGARHVGGEVPSSLEKSIAYEKGRVASFQRKIDEAERNGMVR